jgi:superfamily II DNA/RNA helicase
MIIIDEADVFFSNERDFADIKTLHNTIMGKDKKLKYQYVLFSATYTETIKERISFLAKEA